MQYINTLTLYENVVPTQLDIRGLLLIFPQFTPYPTTRPERTKIITDHHHRNSNASPNPHLYQSITSNQSSYTRMHELDNIMQILSLTTDPTSNCAHRQ